MPKPDLYIELNNAKCRIYGDLKKFNKLRTDDRNRCRNPNAFFIRQKMQGGRNWDGKFYIISEAGYFFPGHLPSLIEIIKEYGWKYKIDDVRVNMEFIGVPKKMGTLTPRKYQTQAVKAVVSRKVDNIYFPYGVLDMATNAGKTLMMCMVHKSFYNATTLILLNDADLYEQFKRELPELLPGEEIGFIRGKEKTWGSINVAMVQTVSRNKDKYAQLLAQVNILAVDECDLANSKSYKDIMKWCYNSTVTVGLSGSIYKSVLAKHKIKNFELKGSFSDIVYQITKREMMDKGYSCEVIIKIVPGIMEAVPEFYIEDKKKKKYTYPEIYDQVITNNKKRHKIILERLLFNIKNDRLPAIVVCRYHEHIHNLYKYLKKKLPDVLVLEYVHGGTPDKKRKKILEDFRLGKIDVLISSYIVKRGKNFPLLQYILNASGSDNQETIIQITGRGERSHESKTKVLLDDIYDKSNYLERHSKHRVNYYIAEKLKVINLVKKRNAKSKKKTSKR